MTELKIPNQEKSDSTRLALTPQFITQSYRMPREVQKGLAKFYQEFPKDAKATTWHVEPISAFRNVVQRPAPAVGVVQKGMVR